MRNPNFASPETARESVVEEFPSAVVGADPGVEETTKPSPDSRPATLLTSPTQLQR